MFDFKFDWCKEMECGVDSVDDQHKVLFRIGRDIEQLVSTKCANVDTRRLLDILSELREYISYHFYFEEEIMRKYHYSKYESHKKMHDDFKNYILQINYVELGNNPLPQLTGLKQYLQDWLFGHILNADNEMCKEISEKKRQEEGQKEIQG